MGYAIRLLKDAMQTAREAFKLNWPRRLADAHARGTSGLGSAKLDGPWEERDECE